MPRYIFLVWLVIAATLAACSPYSKESNNQDSISRESRQSLLRIGEANQKRILYERALAGDPEALRQILLTTEQEQIGDVEGEAPIVLSATFLVAVGDASFARFLRTLPDKSILEVGIALTHMGAHHQALKSMTRLYPSTASILREAGLPALESRIEAAPVSM